MLLVIHNLPSNTRYADVKALIKDKCGLTEMIVDNLVAEGKSKKVTVGLADDADAALLVRSIDGLYVCNQQLYVEDVRQKKAAEQTYRTGSISNQYGQGQFNQCPPPQFDNQFYGQDAMQFQPSPLLSMETQLQPCPPVPNFGVPFYMTAQNQNVGNNPQFMVQYPKIQGPTGNESYEGRNIGFVQQCDGRKRDRSRSRDRGQNRERSPRRLSRWNEPDNDRSDGRRGRDRPAQRHDRHDADRSYKNNPYGNSFQSRANDDYGLNKQNNNKFEKPSNRSEQMWEHSDRSTVGEPSAPFQFNDNRNVNMQEHRYNQEREPQRFKEGNHPQSRGLDSASYSGNFSKKRPYESPDKNKFVPQNKKFGSNQQFHFKNQQGAPHSQFSDNFQNKKPPVRASMPQNKPYMQSIRPQMAPKGFQKNKPQWQPNNSAMQQPKKQINFIKERPAPTVFKTTKLLPNEEMLARHEAWRVQAAAVIATQMLKNMGIMLHKRDPVLMKLKTYVRARIDVIASDDMSLNLREMLGAYRMKFQDDEAFYKAVLKKVDDADEEELPSKMKEPKGGEVGDKKKSDNQNETPPVNFDLKVPPSGTQRLPKYPDGNKKVLSQMKKAQKDEMINDSLYNLDTEHEKALNEELDKFDEVIKQELVNPKNEVEKSLSQFMNDVFVPDLRKVLTLHVKKRILDIRTNLSVRVICQNKSPKRDALDAFLKDYGVVSLKASDRNRNILIAICDSYEHYDALCEHGSTIIDTIKITFKPFHITGPPVKAKFKKQEVHFAQVIDNDGVATGSECSNKVHINDGEDGQKDEINTKENEDIISSNVDEVQATESSECEIILNKNESGDLIEDNVLKSKDVIIIDMNDDKGNGEDKEVIDLDETLTAGTGSDVIISDDKESTNNNEAVTVGDKEIAINDDKTVTNDKEVMEREDREIIDNDVIVEDDLEDF